MALIDEMIDESKDMEPVSNGANSKCYSMGDYVLLRTTNLNKDDIQKLIYLTGELKDEGINVPKTLDYKTIGEAHLGFYKGYILQQRAMGTPLHPKMKMSEYDRLSEEENLKK